MEVNRNILTESIECLYLTFENYTLRPHIDACPCCVDANDQQKIRSRRLRELGPNELGLFANYAVGLFGDADDFKHFLPRLFEILLEQSSDLVAPEILLSKLTKALWYEWPMAEQTAISNFLTAFWANGLSEYPGHFDVETSLCAIAQAVEDVTPFLNYWIEPAKLSYRQHLTDFLQTQLDSINFLLKQRRLSNPWWEDRLEQSRQVILWLEAPTTSEKLETSFFSREEDELAEETLKALDLLSTLTYYLR